MVLLFKATVPPEVVRVSEEAAKVSVLKVKVPALSSVSALVTVPLRVVVRLPSMVNAKF